MHASSIPNNALHELTLSIDCRRFVDKGTFLLIYSVGYRRWKCKFKMFLDFL